MRNDSRNFKSPFLDEEIYPAAESDEVWQPRVARLVDESPFGRVFEQGRTTFIEPEELGEEFIEEQEWADAGDVLVKEAEAYNDESVSDLEDRTEEAYEEDEDEYLEGETRKDKPLTRMKFEFQTKNLIWRNDGKTASGLGRKYGPDDYLVDKKGVRLESETNNLCLDKQRCGGILEFETEWFRTLPKLTEAIDKAVKMTKDMNEAPPSKFDTTRRKFPFNVDHLRMGSAKEKRQGFWDPRAGKENDRQKILGANEELEVEIIDDKWIAGIQSSEGFLLEYYESFLRQHEWPHYRDGAINHAKAILDKANTDGIPLTRLFKLRSFLQIIVNYIMRGQGGKVSEDSGAFADVKGTPAKQAFTLMSRTNFASMYRSLLTAKEKELFVKIINKNLILNEMGLNQQSPVFIKGYGSVQHEPGPTVHNWLSKIINGVDLLSARSGNGLSAAMGRYNVKTKLGENDTWLVKFETRNTVMDPVNGPFREAKDWVKYASDLLDLASKRERDAVHLLTEQGITDENALANFVYHARHPEKKGASIRKGERDLAQEWLRIRDDLVRPTLPGVQPELRTFEYFDKAEFGDDEFEDGEGAHAELLAVESEESLAELPADQESAFDEVESEEEAAEPRPHPSLEDVGEIDIRHRIPLSPVQHDEEVWLEQFDPDAPARLVQLDHWHVPLKPDHATGGFTAGAPAILLKADMNPGFVDASDALITDTTADGLQTCLSKLVQQAGARLLAAKTKPSANDRIRVAVVDLTGNKLSQPEFAGWGSTVAIYGASGPKILGLYAAYQVRSDIRRMAVQGGITNGLALEKEAKAVWKGKKLGQFPDLVWLFDIRKWDSATGPVDFTATASATFQEIMHNCPAGTIIAKASLPFIGSLAWQSGLFHAQRGGLWLKASYCGKGSWSSAVRVQTSHNITALSAATFFTLLAQERLVDAASSADIKKFLRGGCVTTFLPGAIPVVASKCGIWGDFLHDCVLSDDGTVRYAAAVLSRLRTKDDVAAYKKVWTELDALIRNNNQSPKPAC
jgi:hypothetical protein